MVAGRHDNKSNGMGRDIWSHRYKATKGPKKKNSEM